MEFLIVLAVLVVFDVLAVLFGEDSRDLMRFTEPTITRQRAQI